MVQNNNTLYTYHTYMYMYMYNVIMHVHVHTGSPIVLFNYMVLNAS